MLKLLSRHSDYGVGTTAAQKLHNMILDCGPYIDSLVNMLEQ